MTDAAARALAANTNTDPYAAERKAAREEAAASPLNGQLRDHRQKPAPRRALHREGYALRR